MAKSGATTVQQYLEELSPERREAISAVRDVILAHLPEGYEEGIHFGMIGYVVPLVTYPKTYNKQPLSYVALSSQKNYMSLYLMNVYADEATAEWFDREYAASGQRLNRGKSCVRFKTLPDLPLELVGKAVALTPVSEFIQIYESARNRRQ
jgi:hypothetical protein